MGLFLVCFIGATPQSWPFCTNLPNEHRPSIKTSKCHGSVLQGGASTASYSGSSGGARRINLDHEKLTNDIDVQVARSVRA
jgi:hypothetical protein